MPLILCAINFKLSPTSAAIQDRRRVLESIGEVMTQSRRVYTITDFISAEFDKILHLAYYTSSKVFLSGRSQTKSIRAHQSSPTPDLVNRRVPSGTAMKITSWHDAFLQHTRAYLLISTTVDYFMSIGRMPQLGVPPEYLCFMSPLDIMQVPWKPTQEGFEGTVDSSKPGLLGLYMSRASQQRPAPSMDAYSHVVEPVASDPAPLQNASLVYLNNPEHCLTGTNENYSSYGREKRSDLDFLSFHESEPTSVLLNQGPLAASHTNDFAMEHGGQDSIDEYNILPNSSIFPMVQEVLGLEQQTMTGETI